MNYIAVSLLYNSKKYSMCSEPLDQYFELSGKEINFSESSTACWRGYVGSWEIVNDRLYLISINASLEDGSEFNLSNLFPGYPERVFAHWYNGKLRVPEGKMLEYVHMGYASTYEKDLIIEIEKGSVISANIKNNGISEDSDAPEGYGI